MSEDDVTVYWDLSDLAQDLEVLETAKGGVVLNARTIAGAI